MTDSSNNDYNHNHNHPPARDYRTLIKQGLREDIGNGDMTSQAFIAEDVQSCFAIVAREESVLCGARIAQEVFTARSRELSVELLLHDGAHVEAGQAVLRITGNARHMLAAERTALNMLSYLSGIATHTHRCMQAVAGSKAQILDTRKTLPAYRTLAKYAVRCGGGLNHRMRLDDGVMIKDNHIALAGSLSEAVAHARRNTPALTKIEVECDTLEQVKEALSTQADVIMLDNMTLDQMRSAVELAAGAKPLEASGGVTIERLADIAATGVDYISLGSLTHSVKAVDYGMDYNAG